MPALTIEQLEGKRRRVRLSGSARPKSGVGWGVRQRGGVTWYPGNPQASILNLGAEELPVEFIFQWRNRRLGFTDIAINFTPILDSNEAVKVFGDMVREGSVTAVKWKAVEKVGILRELEPVEGRDGEFEISLLFEPAQDGRSSPFSFKALASFSDLFETIRDTTNAAFKVINAPATMLRDVLEDVQEGVGLFNEVLRRGQASIDTYGSLLDESREAAGDATGWIQGIETSAKEIEASVQVEAAELVQRDDAAAIIGGTFYRAQVARAARQARHTVALQRESFLDIENPDILGVHVALAGEDLRKVAWRYYGDAGAWEEIARYNTITGTLLTAGQRVLLPRRGIA